MTMRETSHPGSHTTRARAGLALAAGLLLAAGCGKGGSDEIVLVEGTCQIADADADGGTTTEYLKQINCTNDFNALASVPIDVTLPGARSCKVVLDTAESNTVFFQNSVLYQIHYQFASTHLSGGDLPVVPALVEFNATEYYSPDRRFILGAVTHYEGPGVWALEVSPYDTASAAMITTLYQQVTANGFFGPALRFHPTSEAVATVAKDLPESVPVITTDELYAAIDYQPLTLATAIGRLHFAKASMLDTEYISYQDIMVLDEAPNDISVCQGLITQEFQTPLSHINVLSANRHTPNMGLRGAWDNETLRALEGKLVELTVGASDWSITESTEEAAEAFWTAHMPDPVTLPEFDLSVTDLVDIEEVTPEPGDGETLRDKLKVAVMAFGGKAAHYSILARTENVPTAKAFAVPVYYYVKFMQDNGFFDRVDELLADTQFVTDPSYRDQKLYQFRFDMMLSPLDANLESMLQAKLANEYADAVKIRFRTSTNSEDLDGFPCAGCYESHSGDPSVWKDVQDAIRQTFTSAWSFRTFEERTYYGIDHKTVGMALLVHHGWPSEEANGVAVTSNPFDATGLDPAFYVNVQYGGEDEVVHPPPGVTSDAFLYYFNEPGQPITYMSHSNLIGEYETVLTTTQVHHLGVALDAIHTRFSPAYGPAAGNTGWYAMDVEFKFDNDLDPTKPPALVVKQARPYPGRSGN
jgi:hypothetical protein